MHKRQRLISGIGLLLILLSPPNNLQAIADHQFTWETFLTLVTLIIGLFLIGVAIALEVKKNRDGMIK